MSSEEVYAWRKGERARLIEARMAMAQDDRLAFGRVIAGRLDEIVGEVDGRAVSAYWPFRGEPDLRDWLETVAERGGVTLLPIVTAPRMPLTFRTWRRGEPLARGVWNIPVPEVGVERWPDIVIAPVVGFDAFCYRLGYGGGFFDRTLAAHPGRPLVIGVGYDEQQIDTIRPQPHDIPMDVIVTESRVLRRD